MANYTPNRKYTKKNMSNTTKSAYFKEEPKVEKVKPKVTKLTSKTVKVEEKKSLVDKAVSWIKGLVK